MRACALCATPVGDTEAQKVLFVVGTVGWDKGDHPEDFYFHTQCYVAGREALLGRLSSYRLQSEAQGLGAGIAWIEWPDGEITYSRQVKALEFKVDPKAYGESQIYAFRHGVVMQTIFAIGAAALWQGLANAAVPWPWRVVAFACLGVAWWWVAIR